MDVLSLSLHHSAREGRLRGHWQQGMEQGEKGVIPGRSVSFEKAPQNYFKINFAESKKVPTFAVPTEGNSNERDARSEKKMTDCSLQRWRIHNIKSRSEMPRRQSSLNDHVAQRFCTRVRIAEQRFKKSIQISRSGRKTLKQDNSILFINSLDLTLHFTMESLILAQDER